MAIAKTVESYLERYALPYDVISHPRSMSCRETARVATVPARQIAKAVILHDDAGYLMAVIPGDTHVEIDALSRRLERRLQLASEARLAQLFGDCEPGAIPPLGPAYGLDTIVDDRVFDQGHVCFVAGDHDELVRVEREAFLILLHGAGHAPIGHLPQEHLPLR